MCEDSQGGGREELGGREPGETDCVDGSRCRGGGGLRGDGRRWGSGDVARGRSLGGGGEQEGAAVKALMASLSSPSRRPEATEAEEGVGAA